MNDLNESYACHIGRVEVSLTLSAKSLDPDILTELIQIEPDTSAKFGDEITDYKGRRLPGIHTEGFWTISTKTRIVSKDVNKHFAVLLEIVLPHREVMQHLIKDFQAEAYFDVLWESSYLYAGTGPILSKETIKGAHLLDASIGFDIYQIDE